MLLLLVAACGEDLPPEVQGPSQAELLGVPKGEDLFRSDTDAEEFDGHVERFVGQECRTLAATVAALQARDDTPPGTSRRIANVGGALLPGPIGDITRAIGSDLAASSAARGNLRLAAAEAVRVAKDC